MEQKELSPKELRALEQVKRAQANYAKVRREEKAKCRKEQDHQKYIFGGIVVKYFPEAYDFSEHEMNRIIACAFKNHDIQNMIKAVIKDRKSEVPETAQLKAEEESRGETVLT